ncbi:lamin dm0-related [Anaeramoeba ignava]|uniref:Lamin dm0-related n=1 Tax=Anaeramoeba ignava TaxID=1746090 RepID=A0A9Q0LPV7_ANAIG|nr:lamin dm0-related [Anaeramoeba ignava]
MGQITFQPQINANNLKTKGLKERVYRKKLSKEKDALFACTLEKGFIECNNPVIELFGSKSKKDFLAHPPQQFLTLTQPQFENAHTMEIVRAVFAKLQEKPSEPVRQILNLKKTTAEEFFGEIYFTVIHINKHYAIQGLIKSTMKTLEEAKQKLESEHTIVDNETLFPKQSESDLPTTESEQTLEQTNTPKEETQTKLQTQIGTSHYSIDSQIQELETKNRKLMQTRKDLFNQEIRLLQKSIDEKNEENSKLKNELLVLQEYLEEVKNDNDSSQKQSDFQGKIDKYKEKKKKYKMEVERLTNKLKLAEMEKENLKKLI